MNRQKKELCIILALAMILSMVNLLGYATLALEQLPDHEGTGIFRVDVQVAANDCGNASRGTNSSFRLELLDAEGIVIASGPVLTGEPGDASAGADPLESGQTTSYTFNGENTGANVNVTVPGLEAMAVNKSVSQFRFVEVEHKDDFTHRSIKVYYLRGDEYVEVGKHEYTGVAVQFNGVGDHVVFLTSWFVANAKTVSFDTDTGDTDPVYHAIPGQTITPPPQPQKQGYIFNGWQPEIPLRMPNQDAVYMAQWSPSGYTITFDANGGEGGTEQIHEFGELPVPPVVTREGYLFVGWFPVVVPVTQNAVYTAWWKTETQTFVIFNAGGGTGGTMQVMEKGADLSPPQVSREGYSFTGWLPEVPDTVPDEDAVYVAQWSANEYFIAYHGNGSTSGAMDDSRHTYGTTSSLEINAYLMSTEQLPIFELMPKAE